MTSRNFFVMVKPDGIQRGLLGEIISRFERKGFQIQLLKIVQPDLINNTIREHYAEHEGKSFYDRLIEFSLSGPICGMVLSGNIDVARKIVGSTIPSEAKKGSIRGDYSCSLPQNLVHCSDSEESANREINLWKSIISGDL